MPEVSLVAILDADKEGFLRSEGSLIQTIGRAARHVNGRAILYADQVTGSIRPRRRRDEPPSREAARVQRRAWHHAAVDPQGGDGRHGGSAVRRGAWRATAALTGGDLRPEQGMKAIKRLEAEMYRHARNLEFEEAAQYPGPDRASARGDLRWRPAARAG